MGEPERIRRAQAGDREALGELLAEHYPLLMGYLTKLTLDRALAEDLAQETMLRAIVHLKGFQPRARLSTWLLTIATNLVRDQRRKRARRPPESELEATVPDPAGSPETQGLARLTYRELLEILGALPEDRRMIFVLKHFHGRTHAEIGQIVGCPEGTVKSRLHESVVRIRREVDRRGLR
ncbi:sigma-70 family RNA polymerase sigma factor [Limnochorda pilosa]|uniref:RNA polymerase sigma factor n=1 Tax=Limnochorda pilosa TaxID=1555112 RepID=A0A0K2SN20_LIMPI|nr:sigma-70 family RNA polymerase sigma factor [Limnochorda pilosa]BAS28511.1 RNA polymerase sigma factor SigY [Limnochorda pilosa]